MQIPIHFKDQEPHLSLRDELAGFLRTRSAEEVTAVASRVAQLSQTFSAEQKIITALRVAELLRSFNPTFEVEIARICLAILLCCVADGQVSPDQVAQFFHQVNHGSSHFSLN